jgi:hypothetical protein
VPCLRSCILFLRYICNKGCKALDQPLRYARILISTRVNEVTTSSRTLLWEFYLTLEEHDILSLHESRSTYVKSPYTGGLSKLLNYKSVVPVLN